jgi:hypothetical protein
MAELIKNAKLTVTNSYQTIYTCPAATSAMVVGLIISNVDGVGAATVSVQWLDASDSLASTRIASTIAVPANSSLVLCDKISPLALETGDVLQIEASANGYLVATASIVELS